MSRCNGKTRRTILIKIKWSTLINFPKFWSMNFLPLANSGSEGPLPWQKAPRSAPIKRPRFKKDATQEASVSFSFKKVSTSADVNCAKYGEAQPVANPLTIASKPTIRQNVTCYRNLTNHHPRVIYYSTNVIERTIFITWCSYISINLRKKNYLLN